MLAKFVCLLGRRSGHAQILCNSSESWIAPTKIETNGRHDEPWKKIHCKERTIHNNYVKNTETKTNTQRGHKARRLTTEHML